MPRWWSGFAVLSCIFAGCTATSPPGEPAGESTLRVALVTEPQSWNPLLATALTTRLVTEQLHAPLIRLNHETQQMEPALAESWSFSEDGTALVFRLRRGIRFSDGQPLSSRDVEFTFRALYDRRFASPLVDTARIDGKPLVPEILDSKTISFRLPRRTAAVERLFDGIRILPRHRLEESLEKGTLASDTGLDAEAESIVGLGPFVLREHTPGQRIVLERNPHYWRRGASGEIYPRLDRMVFEIVPSASARLWKLRAGEIDLLEPLTPELFRSLRAEAAADIMTLDLGPGMLTERLWFNLNPRSPIEDYKKDWFRDVRFRRAVSMAIDREALARVVYDGLATPARGPVSPANHFWRNDDLAPPVRDVEAAREWLAEAGFRWDGSNRLLDAVGRRVRFHLVTKAGSEPHARIGAFVQQDLERLGIAARAVPVEASGLYVRITGSFDYDACLLGITQTDPDPSAEMNLWLSRAPLHLWHPGQESPATEWEARIDELMERQMAATDVDARRASFHEVQRIAAEQLPMLDLVVPHVLLAVRRDVQNLRPTPFWHSLWNSEELSIGPPRAETRIEGLKPVGKTRDVNH